MSESIIIESRSDTLSSHPPVVEKDKRITPNRMTKFEFTRIISIRTTQIENGDKIFIEYDKSMLPMEIAIKELINKKLNFTIKRPLYGSGKFEIWHCNELVISPKLFKR